MTPPPAFHKVEDFLCRHRYRLLGAFALLALADVAWAALTYLAYPGYLDHGEPSVALTSWRLLAGIPAYPTFDDPHRVANIYGPLTYAAHALAFGLFGPSLATGKAAGVAAAILLPVAVFFSQRRRGLEAALVAATFAAGLVLMYMPTSIWNRPDSFLALVAVAAVWIANTADPGRPEWTKSVMIAVCGGLAVGFKIHGGIYVAPVVVWHCLNPHRRLKTFAVMCAVGAATALLPFASPLFSLGNLLAWLAPMTGKPSPFGYAPRLLRYGVIFAMPLAFLVVTWWRQSRATGAPTARPPVADLGYAGTYALSVAAAFYLGTKPGAGAHYFYPLVGLTADMMFRFAPRIAGRPIVRWGVVAGVAGIVLGLSVPVQKRFARALHWQEIAAVTTEIRDIMTRYPGRTIEMGVGQDIYTYHRTYYRILLVLAGHPYTIEPGVLTEWSKLKIPFSDATIAMIRGCSTDLWLIPKGEHPFAMIGYYGAPMVEPAFVDAFLANYAKDKSFEYFDVWACKR
jgi:hypothetical protein